MTRFPRFCTNCYRWRSLRGLAKPFVDRPSTKEEREQTDTVTKTRIETKRKRPINAGRSEKSKKRRKVNCRAIAVAKIRYVEGGQANTANKTAELEKGQEEVKSNRMERKERGEP